MMSPFRSEDEHVREQLRRAEEKIQELGEEKAELQRQLAVGRRSPSGVIVALAGMSLCAGLGFMMASIDGRKKEAECQAELRHLQMDRFDAIDTRRRVEADLGACYDRWNLLTQPSAVTSSDCKCQLGDPLCSCVDARRDPPRPAPAPQPSPPQRVFDRAAAAAALGGVDLRTCKAPDGPKGSGHVTVTFEPNGNVTSAVIDGGPFPGTETGKCVAARFRAARVPAFDDAPVRVGKSFTLD